MRTRVGAVIFGRRGLTNRLACFRLSVFLGGAAALDLFAGVVSVEVFIVFMVTLLILVARLARKAW